MPAKNKSYDRDKIGATFTPEHQEKIRVLAGLNYTPREIADYFKVDREQFIAEASDAGSIVRQLIEQGQIRVAADISLKLYANAKDGDVPSIQQLGRIRREKAFQVSKLDLFGGFEDKEIYEKLNEYISSGCSASLSRDEQTFFELLSTINSLDRKFGKRNTVRLLVAQYGMTYAKAVDLYEQADALFYSNRNSDREALRNKYADMLYDWAVQVADTAQSAKDFEIAGDLMMKSRAARGLDREDIQKLPAAMYLRPIRVFSLTPEISGLPRVNRQQLAQHIAALQIPERERRRVRNDAFIEDVNIEEFIAYAEQSQN